MQATSFHPFFKADVVDFSIDKLKKTSKYFNFLSLLRVPIIGYDIYKHSVKIIYGDKWDKFEGSFGLVDSSADISWLIVQLAEACNKVGLVAKADIAWTFPLGVFSIGISTAGLVVESKRLWQNEQFRRLFVKEVFKDQKSNIPFTLDDLRKACDLISRQDSRYLKGRFSVDGKALKLQIHDIFKNVQKVSKFNDPEKKEKGTQISDRCIRNLNTKLKGNVISNSLRITAKVVGIISTIILFFTPLMIVGLGIGGICSSLWLSSFIYDRVRNYRFKKTLNECHKQAKELLPSSFGKINERNAMPSAGLTLTGQQFPLKFQVASY